MIMAQDYKIIHEENPEIAHQKISPYLLSRSFLGGSLESDVYCLECNKDFRRLSTLEEIKKWIELNDLPI